MRGILLVAAMWAGAMACGEAMPTGAPDGGETGVDGGGTSGPDAGVQVVGCNGDSRVSPWWGPGLLVASADGQVKVTIRSSEPAAPARGDNRWTIELTDASDQPLSGASIVAVPFMPAHGHGSSKAPVVTSRTDGAYDVDPLYFSMPGVWRVTFHVTPAQGTRSDAIFYVCIAG